MNNFAQIATNVGNRIGDTSANFQTIINQYINQRYQRIFKKFNWPTLVPAYTFNTAVGTQDYSLPSDFKHELYTYDSTNSFDIKRVDFQELERLNASTLSQQGSVSQYAIFESLTGSPATILKTVRFYQIPNSILAIKMPYIKQASDMSASTDLPIVDMADLASELGATADAWRTKRQFEKASDFEVQYEQIIMEMIWSIENDPNRITQFRPSTYNRDLLYDGGYGDYYQQ